MSTGEKAGLLIMFVATWTAVEAAGLIPIVTPSWVWWLGAFLFVVGGKGD